MRTFVLIGNYGVGNLGDEALKEYFLRRFPEVQWQVVSAHPMAGEYPRFPAGVRSLFAPWWRTLAALRKSEGMVFGGGTLFTDTESLFACFLWWVHAVVAHIFRKPIILAFQGVGPFRTMIGEWFARRTFGYAAFISVRDEASRRRVEAWGLNKEIVQTFDPVFSFMLEQKKMDDTKNLFLIIPRSNSSESFVVRASEIASGRRWDHMVILTLAPGNTRERQVCQSIAQQVGSAKIVMVSSLDHLMEHVARASFVLSQRYHGALAALALGKQLEVVPQGEGDKLEELMKNRDPEALSELAKEGEDALKKVLLIR